MEGVIAIFSPPQCGTERLFSLRSFEESTFTEMFSVLMKGDGGSCKFMF